MDAVASDHGAAALLRQRVLSAHLAKARRRRILLLRDAGTLPSQHQPLAPRLAAESVEQHRLEIASVNRDLRPVVSGAAAEFFRVDVLAEAVEERGLLREHAALGERGFEAELAQLAHGVRQEIDADADRSDLRRRLEHAARDSGAVKHEP